MLTTYIHTDDRGLNNLSYKLTTETKGSGELKTVKNFSLFQSLA